MKRIANVASTVADRAVLERLVRTPSVTGQEHKAVAAMQAQAASDGFHVQSDGAGNFIAETGTGSRLLLFVGHIDTVAGDIPVQVADGELWGRGSVDAKGPLVAAYCAARRHLHSKALRLRIVGAVDEEGGSAGAKALDRSEVPDWIIVGEPSGVHGITLAYKGIVRGSFRLRRERSHGAHPGATAVEQGLALWQDIGRAFDLRDHFAAVQGHLTAFNSATDGLFDTVEAQFHLRLPPGRTPAAVAAELQALAADRGVELHVSEQMAPAQADKRNALATAFRAAIRGRGGEPRLLQKTGTADFNHLAQWFPGVPMVAYGPGDAALDHTPHERLRLADFDAAVDILDAVFAALGRDLPGT